MQGFSAQYSRVGHVAMIRCLWHRKASAPVWFAEREHLYKRGLGTSANLMRDNVSYGNNCAFCTDKLLF